MKHSLHVENNSYVKKIHQRKRKTTISVRFAMFVKWCLHSLMLIIYKTNPMEHNYLHLAIMFVLY